MNYSAEKNILLLLGLLKAYGISKVVASPGGTNLPLVASMQSDPYFEIYSCVDERSAAYMACGIAEESKEPVAISCTGATAARNYMSALTEAYYRKLPIVAITSSRKLNHAGHLYAQMTDRTMQPKDIVVKSEQIQSIKGKDDEWDCNIKINRALSELFRHGGGPVHLNIETSVSREYGIDELPPAKKIERYDISDELPQITSGKIAIFIGSHLEFQEAETEAIDAFCATYNATVYCDHSSNFKGKNRVLTSLIGMQQRSKSNLLDVDLLIHIGEVSGGYDAQRFSKGEVWRVNKDGEMRDLFGCLTKVFEMSEYDFFSIYATAQPERSERSDYIQSFYEQICSMIPQLPFSNLWVAQQLAPSLPNNAVLHLGILNSLRSWNCFEIPQSVLSYSNTGGFGIDGCLSSLIGASLIHKDRLYFICLGDLAFFYDLNSLGNRHIGKNIRILLINNGHGQEFCNYSSPGADLGEITENYIAARGHFGKQSSTLVKSIAENLGFKYFAASNKEDFVNVKSEFLKVENDKPILFEVFTNGKDESEALKAISGLVVDNNFSLKSSTKKIAAKIIGKDNLKKIKRIVE